MKDEILSECVSQLIIDYITNDDLKRCISSFLVLCRILMKDMDTIAHI